MRLGVNPVWNGYTMPNEVWHDLLRSGSDWVSVKVTSPFTFDWGASNGGPGINADTDGNILSLNADQYVQTALKSQANGRKDYSVEGSRLILYYTGVGTWTILGGSATYALISNNTAVTPKRAVLSLNAPASSSSPSFRLLTVDAGDPIKIFGAGLGLIEEEYEAEFLAGNKYHPEYLSMIDFCGDIRFLNPGNVNDSPQVNWADRRIQNYRSQRSQGGWTNSDGQAPLAMTSYEEMIELCNETGKRPWFCIPHQATDAYVTSLANLIKANLDPAIKFRIEWSNECWNSVFEQYDYCETQGLLLWPELSATPWQAAWHYYAKRSGECMDLFDAVFTGGDAARMLKVAAWHVEAESNFRVHILDFTDAIITTALKNKIHRIATAPYLGGDMGANPQATVTTSPYDKPVVDMTETEIIGWMRSGGTRDLSSRMARLAEFRAIADARGLGLDLYECGQHLVNGAGLGGNSALTATLNATNVHAGMESLYYDYLEAVNGYLTDDDAVACLLSDTYPPSSTGDWGWRRTQTTTPTPPKELGIRSFYESLTVQSDNSPFGLGFLTAVMRSHRRRRRR